MVKECILSVDYGDFDTEFSVTLRIKGESRLIGNSQEDEDDGTVVTTVGGLRPAPELRENYKKWQDKYRSLEGAARGITLEKETIRNLTDVRLECKESFETLVNNFRKWLNCEEFRELQYELRTQLDPQEEVRLLILTDNDLLRKMPWETWDLVSRYKKAGVAIGPRRYQRPVKCLPAENLRILAILGNSKSIDIKKDKAILDNLPGAEVKFCVEPRRRQFEQLWQEKWDILFFAGHSWSRKAGETGYLYINERESIEITEIEESLKEAVEKGLKLAIFNSCDGLGLAKKLEKLNIPQVIVWREPVPDLVAQKFLKKFLQEFSEGNSIYAAMAKARAKLREANGLDRVYPGASWLPVVCENPLAEPLKWPVNYLPTQPSPTEKYKDTSLIVPPTKKQNNYLLWGGLLAGGVVLALVGWHFLSQNRTPPKQKSPEKSQLHNSKKVDWINSLPTFSYTQR